MSLRVLAIDDSRTMRNLLGATLGGAGYDVELAEDGLDGLEKLSGFEPDVVITDTNMPNMDGFGFLEAARAQQKDRVIPILVLTTESAPELKARARAAQSWKASQNRRGIFFNVACGNRHR